MPGGAAVTAIGDSVMLAAAPQLRAALPGIYLNAAISRQMSGGLATVRRLATSGQLRPIVVVGLGTNGAVTGGQIRQLRAEIGPGRWLVLVNTYEARPWEHEVNSALAAARNRPRVLLVNWHAAIAGRTSLLWGDGVHPRPAGGILYARLIKAAVLAAGVGPEPPPPAPGVPRPGPAADPPPPRHGIRVEIVTPSEGKPATPPQHARPAYEQARDELTEVVRRLEAGGLTLEQSLELWERGEHLAAICAEWLEGARARLAAATAQRTGEDGDAAAPF